MRQQFTLAGLLLLACSTCFAQTARPSAKHKPAASHIALASKNLLKNAPSSHLGQALQRL